MENQEQDYIIHELDTEMIKAYSGESDFVKNVEIQNQSLGLCWGIKVLDICIDSVSAEKVVLTIKLAGVKVAKITLTTKNACVKVKENVGGDAARVDATICADFGKKEIRAKGKVCALFACAKFNQRILKW